MTVGRVSEAVNPGRIAQFEVAATGPATQAFHPRMPRRAMYLQRAWSCSEGREGALDQMSGLHSEVYTLCWLSSSDRSIPDRGSR